MTCPLYLIVIDVIAIQVIQMTDYSTPTSEHEVVPDDSYIPKTYSYLSMCIIAMMVTGMFAYYTFPEALFVPVLIADAVIWIACGWFGWRNPITLVLPLFTVITGMTLGLLGKVYTDIGLGQIFIQAGILTTVMFVSLTAYVLISKQNFQWLWGFLFASFWILLVGFLISFIFDFPMLELGLSIFGVIVFLCWILYDTSQIVHRWDPDMTPAISALELFMDIIGLFHYLLNVLTHFADED